MDMRKTTIRGIGIRRTAPLLCCGTFVMSVYSGPILENDQLRITFGSSDNGYAITSIENKKSDNARFIYADAATTPNFWALVLSSANPTGGIDRIKLDNRVRTAAKRIDRNGDETRFVWEGVELPDGEKGTIDVVASITLPPGDAASEWRLSVVNRSVKWALRETLYPYRPRAATGRSCRP